MILSIIVDFVTRYVLLQLVACRVIKLTFKNFLLHSFCLYVSRELNVSFYACLSLFIVFHFFFPTHWVFPLPHFYVVFIRISIELNFVIEQTTKSYLNDHSQRYYNIKLLHPQYYEKNNRDISRMGFQAYSQLSNIFMSEVVYQIMYRKGWKCSTKMQNEQQIF